MIFEKSLYLLIELSQPPGVGATTLKFYGK
jgi:hypothetical protein